MVVYVGIILTLMLLGILAVAFFLFAIWRAILGKTSIDFKLAAIIDVQTKRIETLTKGFTKYDTTQNGLKDEMREMNRHFKKEEKK